MNWVFQSDHAPTEPLINILKKRGTAIKPWIELRPMSQINDAIQKVKDNKAQYRIVLEKR